jgi:ubiquinone/menaquinone biosynthesis C-methylase UbiE
MADQRDACYLCGGTDLRPMPREMETLQWPEGWGLVRCAQCDLIFRYPLPSDEEVAAMYSQSYFDANPDMPGGNVELPAEKRERLDRIGAMKPNRGRLLEIGPGHGTFLLEARQRGWDVQGVEISEWAADQLRDQLGLPIITGTIQQANFPDATFDAAYMNHVLEHLRDPIGALQELRRVLKPGGLLVIEVPHEFAGLHAMGERMRRLGGKPAPSETHGRSTHLFFYAPNTLAQVIRRAGFADVQVRTYRSPAYIRDSSVPGVNAALAAVYTAERLMQRAPLLEAFAQ